MDRGRKTFNSAAYAVSHMKHQPFRSATTVAVLALTVAFLLLTSSLFFGLMREIGPEDERQGLLSGRIPGSVDMFTEFKMDKELSEGAKSSLTDLLIFTTVLVFLISFFILHNTMSIAVRERRREIGVLRSIGYSDLEVQKVFLMEGFMTGFLAWVCAIFFGTPLILNLAVYLVGRGEEGFFFVMPSIPPVLLVASLLATTFICLFSTYLATFRTVRAPPVELLKSPE